MRVSRNGREGTLEVLYSESFAVSAQKGIPSENAAKATGIHSQHEVPQDKPVVSWLFLVI